MSELSDIKADISSNTHDLKKLATAVRLLAIQTMQCNIVVFKAHEFPCSTCSNRYVCGAVEDIIGD